VVDYCLRFTRTDNQLDNRDRKSGKHRQHENKCYDRRSAWGTKLSTCGD